MAQLTRLGPGGFSTANLWPSGAGAIVDFAGALGVTAPVLTGDIATTLASFVDLAGALSSTPILTGDIITISTTIVDFAGALTVAPALAGDFTGNVTSGSKYGLGPYGAGPYSRLGPENIVTFGGALALEVALAGDVFVVPAGSGGWIPVAPCPPSMWTPIDPCDAPADLELV